eukprot:6177097-Pleurochrysis_carterae.AAC.5
MATLRQQKEFVGQREITQTPTHAAGIRAVGLEPSGPYERTFVVPTEAEPSRIDAPTSGVVNI